MIPSVLIVDEKCTSCLVIMILEKSSNSRHSRMNALLGDFSNLIKLLSMVALIVLYPFHCLRFESFLLLVHELNL